METYEVENEVTVANVWQNPNDDNYDKKREFRKLRIAIEQEMLHVLAIAVRQITHAYICNLK